MTLEIIKTLSILYAFDPSLAVAIARTESGLNTQAIGMHGEVGLFQVKPSTAKYVADIKDAASLHDPWVNTFAAMQYLTYLQAKCPKPYQVLTCYNMGPSKGKVKIPENKEYVKKVLFFQKMEKRKACHAKPSFNNKFKFFFYVV
jgi:soluble lytic murein transglycosylase-like protein